jgi:NAD(P)-dependent dehydrogenase (short-subunit alcohol dehydrogenase family)
VSKSSRRISGRTVVISGAASGIGRALAQRLSTHGCPVALTDVDELGLKETEGGLTGPTLTRVLDVRDADAQRDFAADVRDWAPAPLGAVFNNAGVEAGKARILVGPDAYLFDILTRVAPTHYYDLLGTVVGRLRSRAQQQPAVATV